MTTSNISVNESKTITLKDDSLQIVDVYVQDEMDLQITIGENTFGSCYIKVRGNGTLNLTVSVLENANWSVLMMNESDEAISFVENWNLKKNANVQLAIGELTTGNHRSEERRVGKECW